MYIISVMLLRFKWCWCWLNICWCQFCVSKTGVQKSIRWARSQCVAAQKLLPGRQIRLVHESQRPLPLRSLSLSPYKLVASARARGRYLILARARILTRRGCHGPELDILIWGPLTLFFIILSWLDELMMTFFFDLNWKNSCLVFERIRSLWIWASLTNIRVKMLSADFLMRGESCRYILFGHFFVSSSRPPRTCFSFLYERPGCSVRPVLWPQHAHLINNR